MLFNYNTESQNNILIVEDEFIIAADIALSLQRLNYSIAGTAATGQDAITLAIEKRPNLIIMDIRLKGDMTGIEAAEIIKSSLDVPIIFLTANSDDATFEKAKSISPESFIIKPVDIKELNAAIQIALQHSKFNSKIIENDNWLNATLESIEDGIVALNNDGNVKFINKAAQTILGCKPDIFENAGFFQHFILYSNQDDRIMEDLHQEVMSSKFSDWNENLYIIDSAGNKKFIKLKASLIHDNWKKISGILIVFQDITKLKFEKQKAKENAEKSDRLKTQFISQMSHEIRTPLNNILTFVSLLRDEFESKLPAGLEDAFKIIDTSSRRLIRTIELLINMSKLQSGNFDVDYQLIDLDNELLEDLCYSFYPKAKTKGLYFNYSRNANNPFIIGDKYSLENIFNNLIDNAVKFTQEGGVDIELCNNEEGDLIIKIKDTGIGMSKEFLPILYTPFSQDSSKSNHELKGTGLGLALVKKYTELNNGSIFVESEIGRGTEFSVVFKAVKEKYRNTN